jgi:hypothetical protein
LCVVSSKEQQLYLNAYRFTRITKQWRWKKLLQHAEIHAKDLGLPKIVMTVISVRDELIAWYKRNGYEDTGEREPFPASDVHIPIAAEPLEFIVMEKE